MIVKEQVKSCGLVSYLIIKEPLKLLCLQPGVPIASESVDLYNYISVCIIFLYFVDKW